VTNRLVDPSRTATPSPARPSRPCSEKGHVGTRVAASCCEWTFSPDASTATGSTPTGVSFPSAATRCPGPSVRSRRCRATTVGCSPPDGASSTWGPTGSLHTLAEVAPAGVRMNDGACDPQGRFWAGAMADDHRAGGGALYRLDWTGRTELMLTGLTISNGLGWSCDGRTMYLVDGGPRRQGPVGRDQRRWTGPPLFARRCAARGCNRADRLEHVMCRCGAWAEPALRHHRDRRLEP
jgi:hypothetical protein